MTPYQFGVKMAVAPQAINMNAMPAPTNTTMGQNLSEQVRLIKKLTTQGRAVPGQPGFSAPPAPAVDPRGSGPRGPLGMEEAGLKARGPLPAAQLQSIYGGASQPSAQAKAQSGDPYTKSPSQPAPVTPMDMFRRASGTSNIKTPPTKSPATRSLFGNPLPRSEWF